ncbi:hypothetical protein GGR28_000561 [Lewinella aquimaris]|uniref:DUF3592 domain-containing protein n=1 Tax=Neolewinella aquimaris TaxID=1835722 RepID=A0A840DYG6_9BACT|nr:hypothetical protein [Neolewinella aquimaris]MBB4077960.1 hypothetical protein [Neolewinella aquimaris]
MNSRKFLLEIGLAFLLSLITGLLLVRWVSFKSNAQYTYGKVVEWKSDEVFVQYPDTDGDSIISSLDLPYNKQKNILKEMARVPVVYDANQPHFFEIPGVYRHSPFGIIVLFIFTTIGVILWFVNLKRESG